MTTADGVMVRSAVAAMLWMSPQSRRSELRMTFSTAVNSVALTARLATRRPDVPAGSSAAGTIVTGKNSSAAGAGVRRSRRTLKTDSR